MPLSSFASSVRLHGLTEGGSMLSKRGLYYSTRKRLTDQLPNIVTSTTPAVLEECYTGDQAAAASGIVSPSDNNIIIQIDFKTSAGETGSVTLKVDLENRTYEIKYKDGEPTQLNAVPNLDFLENPIHCPLSRGSRKYTCPQHTHPCPKTWLLFFIYFRQWRFAQRRFK